MTDRERLIELLETVPADEAGNRNVGVIAEYLLAHGVLVPPCKVGDKVYQIHAEKIYESEIINVIYDTYGIAFEEKAIGKSIFLTREDAERAFEERRKENDR